MLEPDRVIDKYDVIVVGHGLAGLCAGLRAAEADATVAILEKAPKEQRGGQTQFTHAIRVPSTDTDLPGHEFEIDYSPSDFYQDTMSVTRGRADQDLAKTLVETAGETIEWLTELGVDWEYDSPMGRPRSSAMIWHPGYDGENTLETLAHAARDLSVTIFYETEARTLHRGGSSRIRGLSAIADDSTIRFECDAVVIAAGGYESNAEKRTRYMGPQFDEMKVRGSRHVTGEAIDMAIDVGGNPAGQWSGAHVVMVDPALPEFEGGIMKINGFPYGVILNHDGERFVDEGADMQSKTYAEYGRKAFEQPDHEAFVIFDSKTRDHVFSSGPSEPISADTLESLVRRLDIADTTTAVETIEEFNEACDPDEFEPEAPDGNATDGVEPPKSNWALPIDDPPFYGFPTTGGITFTFGGLHVNTRAEVLDTGHQPVPGLYAAGNSTGRLFYYAYPGGSGQTNAAVYGRIAGERAAEYVRSVSE